MIEVPGTSIRVKAFRIFANVFVVPERYRFGIHQDESLEAPVNPYPGSVYNQYYLSESDEKTEYLKKIDLLLKRLLRTAVGKSLLSGLSNSLPLKYMVNPNDKRLWDSHSTVNDVTFSGQPKKNMFL